MRLRLALFAATAGLLLPTCGKKTTGNVVAKQIGSRAELIGGPGALGEVGDYLLANDQIRVIIQGGGYSRGFGVYGGALIDADLQRPQASGDASRGGSGYDNFSELFPAIFLKAMKPREGGIKAVPPAEGGDGSASIEVRGDGGDFLFMLTKVNDLIIGADRGIFFKTEYKLRPGARYVEITTTVTNGTGNDITLPSDGVSALTMGKDFSLPVGDVILFGAGNKVFAEGAGFDIRYTLEALYKNVPPLPALPGLVTPFLATKGKNISYGFMSGVTDPALSFVSRANYPNARPDDMLVPFLFSAFTGSYYAAAPKELANGASFSFKKYFIVGKGDVAAIRDVAMDIRKETVGGVSGTVRDAMARTPEEGVSVVTYDADGRPYNQHTTDGAGRFMGKYQPGKYSYRLLADGRAPTAPVSFEVTAEKTTQLEIELAQPGLVAVRSVGADGRPLPAKCSLVARYGLVGRGADPKTFLYSLALGEERRPVDLIPDTDDPATREYLEHVIHAAQGSITEKVRPGKYRAVCSRGPEYGLVEKEIEVRAGELTSIDVKLDRVVDTTGWASGDYHLHAVDSVDSDMSLEARVSECATAGLDIALTSDHNFVADYRPTISRLGLDNFLQGMVGLELTTLEIGHFNGFPLRFDPGPITKGAFPWSGRPPKVLFEDLRSRGAYGPENTVVQVNHPRDSILGYFNQYNFDQETGEVEEEDSLFLSPEITETNEFGPSKFNSDFDALEIFNGKRYELLHTFRVPEQLPEGIDPSTVKQRPGEMLRDESGKIAFPGGLEDWFTMLDMGKRYTATGNSDSHESEDEPGVARTFIPVSNDHPGQIDEREIIAAMKSQRAVPTNGPLVLISAGGKGMGETADARSGSVDVTVETRVAPWIQIDTVNLIVNGQTVESIKGTNESLARITRKVNVTKDSWILAEVRGSKSMWPVVTPLEVPSIQVSDAVGSIASSFGLSFGDGPLAPSKVSIAYAYAFTNPVYLDADGGGFAPPGVQHRGLRAQVEGSKIKRSDPRKLPALMKLFYSFEGH